jgi:hypothetical protein
MPSVQKGSNAQIAIVTEAVDNNSAEIHSETIRKQNHSPGETGQHWSLQHPELPANTKAEEN